MSAVRSTGSPGLDRTPSLKKHQMDENSKVSKDDFSIATVGDQLKSLLVFVSTPLPTRLPIYTPCMYPIVLNYHRNVEWNFLHTIWIPSHALRIFAILHTYISFASLRAS
jgi:hypothetical protein